MNMVVIRLGVLIGIVCVSHGAVIANADVGIGVPTTGQHATGVATQEDPQDSVWVLGVLEVVGTSNIDDCTASESGVYVSCVTNVGNPCEGVEESSVRVDTYTLSKGWFPLAVDDDDGSATAMCGIPP